MSRSLGERQTRGDAVAQVAPGRHTVAPAPAPGPPRGGRPGDQSQGADRPPRTAAAAAACVSWSPAGAWGPVRPRRSARSLAAFFTEVAEPCLLAKTQGGTKQGSDAGDTGRATPPRGRARRGEELRGAEAGAGGARDGDGGAAGGLAFLGTPRDAPGSGGETGPPRAPSCPGRHRAGPTRPSGVSEQKVAFPQSFPQRGGGSTSHPPVLSRHPGRTPPLLPHGGPCPHRGLTAPSPLAAHEPSRSPEPAGP